MRRGDRIVLLLGCIGLLSLTACVRFFPSTEPVVRVDGAQLAHRYLDEQKIRSAGAPHWGVEGILDLETPDQARRNRVDMMGSGGERMRLRAFGPFQQVALELLTTPSWMRWVDPQKQRVIQVPATAEGMRHLIGLPLTPPRLFQLVMGRAASLAGPGQGVLFGTAAGVPVTTREGERLLLDPVHGRILERFGEAVPGTPYHAVYAWPERPGVGPMALPERILVTLEHPGMRLELIFKRWFLPGTGMPDALFSSEVPPGFILQRPLDEEHG
ncbi:MAG: hypothetical protein HQM02_01860 [Magnetococcales bacterium]|nr:hypothetical protein [Magnetococcales bacterium]